MLYTSTYKNDSTYFDPRRKYTIFNISSSALHNETSYLSPFHLTKWWDISNNVLLFERRSLFNQLKIYDGTVSGNLTLNKMYDVINKATNKIITCDDISYKIGSDSVDFDFFYNYEAINFTPEYILTEDYDQSYEITRLDNILSEISR